MQPKSKVLERHITTSDTKGQRSPYKGCLGKCLLTYFRYLFILNFPPGAAPGEGEKGALKTKHLVVHSDTIIPISLHDPLLSLPGRGRRRHTQGMNRRIERK